MTTRDSYRPYPKRLIDRLDWARAQEDGAARKQILRELRKYRPAREDDVVAGARLEEVIGWGQFANVWRAVRESDGALCAVKIFHADKLGQGRMAREFRQGVAAMRLLGDFDAPRSIVALHQADDAQLAFSMTYVSNGDLRHLPEWGWTLEKKLGFFRRLCEAVRFAHEHEIIHRDVKPANVLIDDDYEAVLTDFDLADLLELALMTSRSPGTFGYAAPEQIEKNFMGLVDPRLKESDIFSLGRVLQFMLTEHDPKFYGPDMSSGPDIDDVALQRIVRRCTLIDPRQRYRSVNALLADLDQRESRPLEVGLGEEEAEPAPHSLDAVAPQDVVGREDDSGGGLSTPPGSGGANWGKWAAIGTLLAAGAGWAGLFLKRSIAAPVPARSAAVSVHSRPSADVTGDVAPVAKSATFKRDLAALSRQPDAGLDGGALAPRAQEWLRDGMGRLGGDGTALPLRDKRLVLSQGEVQLGSFSCGIEFDARGNPKRATHCVGRGAARTSQPVTVPIGCSLHANRRFVSCQSEPFRYSLNAVTRTGRFFLSLGLR